MQKYYQQFHLNYYILNNIQKGIGKITVTKYS